MTSLEEYREQLQGMAEGKAIPGGSGATICANRQFARTIKSTEKLYNALEKGMRDGGQTAISPSWDSLPPLP